VKGNREKLVVMAYTTLGSFTAKTLPLQYCQLGRLMKVELCKSQKVHCICLVFDETSILLKGKVIGVEKMIPVFEKTGK